MKKRNISEVYDEYQIPPWLAMHMHRVAAVAATVFDARRALDAALSEADRDTVITACLLHDMANIIKFDFTILGPEVGEKGQEHWESVQRAFFARYGRNEHHATLVILGELGVSRRVIELVDSIGFLNNEATALSGDTLKKIVSYADSRVVPSGISSLAERMRDMHLRYSKKHPKDAPETERNIRALYDIEEELFLGLTIRPEDITEDSVAVLRDKLSRFDIACAVE